MRKFFYSFIVLFFIFGTTVYGATITVTNINDTGAGSLRQAVTDAVSGDKIVFDSSISGQTITLTTFIQLTNKTITIEGNSTSRMILSNSSSTEGFHFVVDSASSLTLKNLEITSGYSYSGNSDKGGSITVTGTLNIDNCLFYSNVGYSAGVIWGNNSASQINISNSSFFDNNATNTGDGAGVIIAQGPITIKNSTFANNRGHAGALMIGTLTSAVNKIENTTIVNNISYGSDKGVIRLNNAPVKVKNTIFYNNKNNNGAGTDNAFNGEYGGAIITSYGYNFVPSSSATFTPTTGDDLNNTTNPNLVPILQNGYTVAYNLPNGSLFIDSGSCTAIDNTTISTDQRGYTRPVGNGCDKGAIEYGAMPPLSLTIISTPTTTAYQNVTYSTMLTGISSVNLPLTWSTTTKPSWLQLTNASTTDVTTLAGDGTTAILNNPQAITADSAGNLYAASADGGVVKKITPAGVVTTFATIANPNGLAFDSLGNLYISSHSLNNITKITPSGTTSVFATGLSYPGQIAIDSSDNLFVTGNDGYIKKITQAGVVSTFSVYIESVAGVAIDKFGNMYATDYDKGHLYKIASDGNKTLIAGDGTEGGSIDGTGAAVKFSRLTQITTDAFGNIYAAEQFGHKIRKITPAGVVTTIAGTGTAGIVDGVSTSAQFQHPAGITFGIDGALYVGDGSNHRVRKITLPHATLSGTPTTAGNFLVNAVLSNEETNTTLNFTINIPTSSSDDNITASESNATIDGLGGVDTLILSGIKSSYTVTKNADGNFTVVGGGFTYTLINIEKLSFSDVQNVAIDSLVKELTLKAHGGAVQFPGQTLNDNVVLPTINALNNTQHFTIETWVKISSANPYGNIFNYKVSIEDRIVIQQLDTGKLHVIIGNSSTGNSNHQGQYPMLTNDVWHHLTVSYDGTQSTNSAKLKVYVDGVLQTATYLDSMPLTTANYSTVFPQIGTALNGQIDEFRIWSSSRSQSEIQATMNKQLDGNESGLVAYYNFDERVGTTIKDRTTNGYNGTIIGNVQRVNFLGDTLHFNGTTNSFVQIPGGGYVPTQSQGFTIGAWSKIVSPGVRYHELFRVNGTGISYSLRYHTDTTNTDNLDFFINYRDSNNTSLWEALTYTVGSNFLNKWHYSAVTFDSSSIKLYLDGVMVASKVISIDLNGTMTLGEAVIGTNQSTNTDPANNLLGDVAEVSVWNRSLTQTEIQKLMASSPNLTDSSLVGYWPLNEGSGTVAKDYAGDNNGTIAGANWIDTAPLIYGDTIYTDYGLNSWFRGVGLNITNPNFSFNNIDKLKLVDSTSGLFRIERLSNEASFNISETTSSLSLPIFLKSARNIIEGSESNDTVNGTKNDDVITVNRGFDTINGLDGNDTVVFDASFDTYEITWNQNGSLTVTSMESGGGLLNNIEYLSFSDVQDIPITNFIPNITSNLIAHYKFDGNANDSSGNSYNGTYNNFGTGKFGQSASFDGSQSLAISGAITSVLPSAGGARTVSMWIKPTVSNSTEDFVSWGANVSNQRFSVMKFASAENVTGAFGVAAGVAASDFIGDYSINASSWQHLTAVYEANGTNIKFYVNGTLVNTLTIDRAILQTASGNPLYIGSNPEGTGEWFNGLIDEVRIYNRALSSNDVASLYSYAPPLSMPNEITPVASGSNHTLFLDSNGSVYGVGQNTYGQLGVGDTTDRNSSVIKLNSISDVKQIAAGAFHSLFLKADGTVYVSGKNIYGQLGLGDITDRTTPTQISSLSGIVQIVASNHSSYFLKNDGTVYSTGFNTFGGLGLGSTIDVNTTTKIAGLSGIKQIAAGSHHALFLKNDGTVYAVGGNSYGQLGIDSNTTNHRYTPTLIPSLSGIAKISAGSTTSFFIDDNGSVYASGSSAYGQLGKGSTGTVYTPIEITALSSIVDIVGGENHTLFLDSNGTAYSTGYNLNGQLGLGDTTQRVTPVQISSISNISAISSKGSQSLFYTTAGSYYGAGSNSAGQLGDSNSSNRVVPTQISIPMFANENFVGTVGDNLIVAPELNVTINGLGGVDTVIFSGIKSSYIVTKNPDGTFTVVGGGFSYTLINIEKLSFSDVQDVLITTFANIYSLFTYDWVDNFKQGISVSNGVFNFSLGSGVLSAILEKTTTNSFKEVRTKIKPISLDGTASFSMIVDETMKIQIFGNEVKMVTINPTGGIATSGSIFDADTTTSFQNKILYLNMWLGNGKVYSNITDENQTQIGRIVELMTNATILSNLKFEAQIGNQSFANIELQDVLFTSTPSLVQLKRLDFLTQSSNVANYISATSLDRSNIPMFYLTTITDQETQYIHMGINQDLLKNSQLYSVSLNLNSKNQIVTEQKLKENGIVTNNLLTIGTKEQKYIGEMTSYDLSTLFSQNNINFEFSSDAKGYRIYEKNGETVTLKYALNQIAVSDVLANFGLNKNSIKSKSITTLWTYLALPTNINLCIASYQTSLPTLCNQDYTVESVFGSIDTVYKHTGYWSYFDSNTAKNYNFDKLGSLSSKEGLLVKSEYARTLNIPYDISKEISVELMDMSQKGWSLVHIPFDMTLSELSAKITAGGKTLKHIFRFKNNLWDIYAPQSDNNFASSIPRITTLQSDDIVWIEVE